MKHEQSTLINDIVAMMQKDILNTNLEEKEGNFQKGLKKKECIRIIQGSVHGAQIHQY